MLRTGVVAVLALGSLAVTATPALADAPSVTIRQLSNTVDAGETTQLRYRIEAGPNDGDAVNITVDISGGNLSCDRGDCGGAATLERQGFGGGFSKDFTATLKASDLAPGSSSTATVRVLASNADGQGQSAAVRVTLRGPDKPDTIKSISGRVVNITNGRGIPDADVALNDSAGHSYTSRTDGDGDFKFTSSDSKPISPGRILLGAGKEGFENKQTSTDVGPGQSKTGLRITLKSKAQPSPSASTEASPTPEESAEELASDLPSTEESVDPAAAGNNSDSGGGGLFSWVLIILGGLLVALGVGAIVLLLVRRKGEGEDDAGDPLPGPNGPRPTPGAQGVFRGGPEPTMVVGGAPMGGGPTMAMRPGLADAPTMMHQPVDEYGDPYGTPLRAPSPGDGTLPGAPQPGYGYQGANQGGYAPGGGPTAPMPGSPTAYGSASPTAYGGPAGRASASVSPPDPYAPRDRDYGASTAQPGYGYEEPTGRYDRNGGGYGPEPGGYDQGPDAYRQPGNGYDREYGPGGASGYGPDTGYSPGGGNGYGANGYEPAQPGGGYDGGRYQASPPAGYGPQGGYEGYGQPTGYPPRYEQGGYDQPAGYERPPEPRGGYDQQQRGYDQDYYDEPPRRGERQSRRSLDWLDD